MKWQINRLEQYWKRILRHVSAWFSCMKIAISRAACTASASSWVSWERTPLGKCTSFRACSSQKRRTSQRRRSKARRQALVEDSSLFVIFGFVDFCFRRHEDSSLVDEARVEPEVEHLFARKPGLVVKLDLHVVD